MPARPHRTVDRVTGILETVSLSPRGVTLAELATALGAAKTSLAELTNGLLARGYLIEEEHRFHLGPGPFVLASRATLAALSLDHELVAELGKALGCPVLVGVRVGDAMIFTDYTGQESPSLTFAARTHARRPSTPAPPERSCSPTSPTTRCTASSMAPAPSMRATCGSSSPSSPRSAPADWPSTAEPRSRTRSSWPPPVGTRRPNGCGYQCRHRQLRGGSSRRPRRGTQEGSRRPRFPIRPGGRRRKQRQSITHRPHHRSEPGAEPRIVASPPRDSAP